jgi:hypothetical protein
MKLHNLGTMKISEAIPNQYTTLIMMVVGHQKIERRTLKHIRKKDTQDPPTKNSCRAAKEAARQIRAEVMVKVLTHSNLRIECIMTVKLITTPKIAPFSLSQKKKNGARFYKAFAAICTSRNQSHHAMSPTTSNTFHPILHFFHCNPTRTPKPNL